MVASLAIPPVAEKIKGVLHIGYSGLDFFHCSTSLQPRTCLLAYRSTYNAFFMDLPVSSFVSHSPLLALKPAKGVNLVPKRCWCPRWLPFLNDIFHSGYFDCRSAFRTVLDS